MQIPPLVYEVSRDPAPFKPVRPQWLYWLTLLVALLVLGWLVPATRYVVSTICIGWLGLAFASATILPTQVNYALSGNGFEVRGPKGNVKEFISYEDIDGVELTTGATRIKHKRGIRDVPAMMIGCADFHKRLIRILEAPTEQRSERAAQPVETSDLAPESWSRGSGRGASQDLGNRPSAVMNREQVAILMSYMAGPNILEISDLARGKPVFWGTVWLGVACIFTAIWIFARAAMLEFFADRVVFQDRWSEATFGYSDLSSVDYGFFWCFRAPGMKPVWFSPFAMADLLAFVKRKQSSAD